MLSFAIYLFYRFKGSKVIFSLTVAVSLPTFFFLLIRWICGNTTTPLKSAKCHGDFRRHEKKKQAETPRRCSRFDTVRRFCQRHADSNRPSIGSSCSAVPAAPELRIDPHLCNSVKSMSSLARFHQTRFAFKPFFHLFLMLTLFLLVTC